MKKLLACALLVAVLFTGHEIAAQEDRQEQGKKIQKLIGQFKSSHTGPKAVDALAKIGKPAVESLIKALKDRHGSVRVYAAKTLGEIGDKKAIEPLIEALKSFGSMMRYHPAVALGRIGDKKAVGPLIQALESEHELDRTGAAMALGEIGDKKAVDALLQALKDKWSIVRGAAAEALGEIQDKKAVEALRILWKEQGFTDVRLRAAYAVFKVAKDEEALEFLMKNLKDNHPDNRKTAAMLLGRIGDKRAVGPLLQTLHHKNETVRRAVANALGVIGGKKALEALIEALEYADTRQYAKQGLVKIGKPAVTYLTRALGRRTKEIRTAAIDAMGEIGDKDAVKPLIKALKHKDEDTRRCAADALVKIGEPAVEALIDVLKAEDIIVRFYIAETLKKITGRDFGTDYEKWKAWHEKSKKDD